MLLREKDRQSLIQIFSTTKIPLEVWAYGSRVNGTAHFGIDLDLVARSHNLKPLPANVYIDLSEKIRDSNIPILIEFRDWAMLPETFHHNIKQQFEVLYSNVEIAVNEPLPEYQTKISADRNDDKI